MWFYLKVAFDQMSLHAARRQLGFKFMTHFVFEILSHTKIKFGFVIAALKHELCLYLIFQLKYYS